MSLLSKFYNDPGKFIGLFILDLSDLKLGKENKWPRTVVVGNLNFVMAGKNLFARQQRCYVTNSDCSVNDRVIILTRLSDRAGQKGNRVEKDDKQVEEINFSNAPYNISLHLRPEVVTTYVDMWVLS